MSLNQEHTTEEDMRSALAALATICLGGLSTPSLAQQHNLSAAVADFAGAKICDRLKNRFRGLQRTNAQGDKVYSGTLWIHACEVTYDPNDQNVMTLDLGIKGWRWLEREKEKLGASFNVDEFVRFEINTELTGRTRPFYAPEDKKLAFWFTPVEPPEVNFKSVGDVDVDKEGMWGVALAGAATLIGESPDTVADQKLVDKAEQRFSQKMSDGFSAAIDLCSGRIVSALGQLDQATLFTKLDSQQNTSFKQVELAPSSFLLFGPYGEQSQSLDLELQLGKATHVQHRLICAKDAIQLAQAYMKGNNRTPEVPELDLVKENIDGGKVSMQSGAQSCPVVTMLSTDDTVAERSAFKYKVVGFDDPQPLLQCE